MPSLHGVGCAYVFAGAWSCLVAISMTHVPFWLNGCHLLADTLMSVKYCLTKKANMKSNHLFGYSTVLGYCRYVLDAQTTTGNQKNATFI